jgi:two-component system sensor histidine kinase KdpD
VHMVTHERAAHGRRLPARGGALSLRRRLAGGVTALVLLPLLTVGLAQLRDSLSLPSQILCYLIAVVTIALIGGLYPALAAALAASLLINYYFTPPLYSFTIAEPNNIVVLAGFLVVAAAVSSVVDLAARRTRQAARATAEAETLLALASSVLSGERALPALLDKLRETFGMDSAALLHRDVDTPIPGEADAWSVVAYSGLDPCASPETADITVPAGEAAVLALRGRALPTADQRVLAAFAARAATALEQRRLSEKAAQAAPLAEVDRFRTALLAAVSHDLRTPLASAKAALGSLRDPAITWSAEDQAELLATADESLDRLITLVTNLLDTSRLQTGAMSVLRRPLALDEVVPLALDDLDTRTHVVQLDVPSDLPEVIADPDLLQRVLANLTNNAVQHTPPGTPVLITASALGERVELRVIDRGPGVPSEARDSIFAPFQRLGDRDNTTGVGLGLALSRGLVEAMHGSLTPEETPGGGLTMVLTLPAHRAVAQPIPQPADSQLT